MTAVGPRHRVVNMVHAVAYGPWLSRPGRPVSPVSPGLFSSCADLVKIRPVCSLGHLRRYLSHQFPEIRGNLLYAVRWRAVLAEAPKPGSGC